MPRTPVVVVTDGQRLDEAAVLPGMSSGSGTAFAADELVTEFGEPSRALIHAGSRWNQVR